MSVAAVEMTGDLAVLAGMDRADRADLVAGPADFVAGPGVKASGRVAVADLAVTGIVVVDRAGVALVARGDREGVQRIVRRLSCRNSKSISCRRRRVSNHSPGKSS